MVIVAGEKSADTTAFAGAAKMTVMQKKRSNPRRIVITSAAVSPAYRYLLHDPDHIGIILL